MLKELEDESDRGCALIGAALLDQGLATLLSDKFPSIKKLKLVEDHGLLQGFGAKITMAAALDLITDDERKLLTRINGVRNEFAHPESVGVSFEAPSAKIRKPLEYIAVPKGTFDKAFSFGVWMVNRDLFPHYSPRMRFTVVVATLAVVLHGKAGEPG